MSVLSFRLSLVASCLLLCGRPAHGQEVRPPRDPRDSVDVTALTFPGASAVSTDDLKRVLFTRTSTCRLPFLIPVCKLTPNQLFTDRRRTTSAALGEDITALRVYYWQRGFREAQVDTLLTPTKRGYAVAFRIVEGTPTRISALDVVQRPTVLSARELGEAVVLHTGEPLSLIALDTTLTRLKVSVWNKGYGNVRIDTTVPRPDASHDVPMRITIVPGPITHVGSVVFQGNEHLSDATLLRGVMVRPGALYTYDGVLESQKRLLQSPAIARALVITPAPGDSLKALTVAVSEAPPHHAELTLGFNTIEFGQAAGELRLNDLGAGRWLRLHVATGNLLADQLDGRAIFQRSVPADADFDRSAFLRPTYQTTLTLTQPWIAGARTSAALTAFGGRRSLVGVVIDEDVGADLGIVRELATRAPIGINYRVEATRVQASAVYFCAGYGICDPTTVQSLSRLQRLAPVAVSASIDRADDLEVPTSGYTALLDAEHASSATGSNFAHNRIAADAALYHRFGQKPTGLTDAIPMVLALHGRAGFVRPLSSDRASLGVSGDGEGILHPRARFYAGGMQSVRGFAENELGPRVLQVRSASLLAVGCTTATIANGQCDPTAVPNEQIFPRPTGGSSLLEGSAELRVPLMKLLIGVLFLDGAYVGTSGLLASPRGKGAITPGGGFRYRSPLGVLRLDLGIRPVGAETLPVVVASTDAAGNETVVQLAKEKSYSPITPTLGTLHSIARRLVVHFAMGQAF
jgi:outer membrane protein insertion porin family/translocation and assembly module TamA